MTEEEQIIMAMIEQGLIPLGAFDAAVNQYGQGSDYLQLEDTPVAWDRAADMDDLIGDALKRTGLYLEDFVDLPYERVEDPGQYEGYRNFTSPVIAGNVAAETVMEAMQDGMSFDEAVNLVIDAANSDDPAVAEPLRANLPRNADGEIDVDSFRSTLSGAVTDQGREDAEFGAWDAERQAFEDYTRSRTGLDLFPAPVSDEDFTARLLPTGFDPAQVANVRPATVPGSERRQEGVFRTDSSIRGARGGSGQGRPQQVERRRGDYRTSKDRNVSRDSKGRTGSDVTFDRNRAANESQQAGRELALRMRAQQQVPSRKAMNDRALMAAYNKIIYGGDI